MKKIGILTYFWAHNPGTFLQAYTTVKAFNQQFPNYKIELIDYKLRRPRFKISKKHLNFFSLVDDIKNYNAYKKCQEKLLPLGSESLLTYDYNLATEFIKRQRYDLIIVGADTCLEFLPKHFQLDQIPVYWLSPDLECKKVMCSSSAGAMTVDVLNNEQKEKLSNIVNAFDLIGVRDDNTYKLISGLRDDASIVERTPDPTFWDDIDYGPVKRFLLRNKITFESPIVAINLPYSLEICQYLIEYFGSKGFIVILLGYSNAPKSTRFPKMSPLEWCGIHRYFTLEITDRFHGTVYALKNHTPVVVIDHEDRKVTKEGFSKTYSLLKLFNLEKSNYININRINDMKQIINTVDRAINVFEPHNINQTTQQLKKQYADFLYKIARLLEKS